jgi:hypothetical protein
VTDAAQAAEVTVIPPGASVAVVPAPQTRVESYGSRKWLLTVVSLFSAIVLCWTHRISGGEYVAVVSIATGMYKIANVASNMPMFNQPQGPCR